jgi:predicted SAM-dependent methyltransferase
MKRDLPPLLPMPEGMVLNVGAGFSVIPGAIPVDWPQWDADTMPLPFEDGAVDGIHAYHFLEHVREPIAMLQEFQRVLRPGGVLQLAVPYYNSFCAHQDLDHKSWFNEDTWKGTFTNQYYRKFPIEWKLRVHFNAGMFIVERNIVLLTQMERMP